MASTLKRRLPQKLHQTLRLSSSTYWIVAMAVLTGPRDLASAERARSMQSTQMTARPLAKNFR